MFTLEITAPCLSVGMKKIAGQRAPVHPLHPAPRRVLVRQLGRLLHVRWVPVFSLPSPSSHVYTVYHGISCLVVSLSGVFWLGWLVLATWSSSTNDVDEPLAGCVRPGSDGVCVSLAFCVQSSFRVPPLSLVLSLLTILLLLLPLLV